MQIKGVDLSYHNKGVSFDKLKELGYKFVILRVGIRGYRYPTINKDKCFEEFYKEARRVGLGVGCYFFTQAITEAEAKEEANWVLETIKGKVFEYPVYIDQEWGDAVNHTGRADYNTVATNTAVCKAFCETIQNAGYYAGIYCADSWLTSKVYWKQLLPYDKWIAKWSVFKPSKNRGDYGMWQNTNNLNIGGKRIDGNIATKDYPNIMLEHGLNGVTKPLRRFDVTIKYISDGDVAKIKELCNTLEINCDVKEV